MSPRPESRNQRSFKQALHKAKQRRLLLERLEVREVMDATPHNIAAANIEVVQVDTTDAGLSLSSSYSFNDFRLRAGSIRGNYNVQIGDSAADDPANGILLSSVRNNGRDNGESTPAAGVTHYGTVGLDRNASGYSIPVFDTSTNGYAGGTRYNFDVSAAYFPYSDGWLGGHVRNSTNNGPLTNLLGAPGLALGTHVNDLSGGRTQIDLRSLGVNSQADGVLIVNGGKNEDNFALSTANSDGTWTIFNKDNGSDGTGYEQDPVSFVYVPLSNTSVIAGKFAGNLNPILQNAPFTVTKSGNGRYRLEIAGQSPQTGVLVISAEGGVGNNIDNPVSFVPSGNGWEIQSRDLPNMGLQDLQAADPVVSFVFIPGPTPGVKITPDTGLLTSEVGGTASFSLVLDTKPASDVTIELSSSDTTEGILNVASVTFTPDNWNLPQTVTVTGQDDGEMDGAVEFSIVTTAVSSDASYNGRAVADIAIRNADNEAGITVNPTSASTTEAGGSANFTIQLNTQPTANVLVAITSDNTAEGTVSLASVVFTPDNWNLPQTVVITGVDDPLDEGDVSYAVITAAATSDDPAYNGLNPTDVSLINVDNDTAGITLSPLTQITVRESGASAPVTIVLDSAPIADVTISLSSTNPTSGGTLSTNQLTFTAANWNVPQVVTVSPVDDFAQDAEVAFTVVTTSSSSDPLYDAAPVPDVSVTTLDNEALITLLSRDVAYGIGSTDVGLGALATITDADTADYDGGALTVSQTGSVDVNDRIEIRNLGNAAGQIGVAGNVVSYGGTPIATFTGGNGHTPLSVNFNSSATPLAAQALVRAITFRNVGTNPITVTRTVAFVLNDGDGGMSNAATLAVRVGLANVMEFQEGVDRGFGVYSGQADIQLNEQAPNTAQPQGNGARLFVDWPDVDTANTQQTLLRYDNLFGDGPGQIPLGATIVSAELILNTVDSGDGGTLHRMLTPWDSNSETWNTFGSGQFPRNSQPGIQTDDVEAKAAYDSQWGLIDGSGSTGVGAVAIGVTPDLQAWSNGQANNGWLITGWSERRDGTGFSQGESVDSSVRPRLRVVWVPAGVQGASFRQGVNGYTGTEDTVLREADPDVNFGTDISAFVDAADAANENQVLLKFGNIIGSGPGQIPAGSQVHAAVLTFGNTITDGMGDGGRFHRMIQPWSQDTATWNSLGSGVQPDGTEAAPAYNTQAGNLLRDPDVQGGFTPFDVTTDLQAWVRGTQANEGWAILPWPGGTNGWGFITSDAVVEAELPQLRVFFTPPGVTITPQSGLVTSESGGTATFTIELNTAPTADVTIPLSSSNTGEGTISPASITFTSENWNVPQTVTISGVNDALGDGATAYLIVTGPATSTDPAYSGLDAADVEVTNADNDSAGITVQPISGLVTTEAGGTAAFTVVLDLAPTANVVIQVSSSNSAEGTVDTTTLAFSPANWNTPQTVTVMGANDFAIDGDVAYTIVLAPAVSNDSNYNGFDAADVAAVNQDNDVAGITVSPTSGLITTEAGGTATFNVVLNSRPTADVSFGVSSSNSSEGNVSTSLVTFTPDNWNIPQTITVTGVNDSTFDGAVNYGIVTEAANSGDQKYNGLNPADVTVTNIDGRPVVTLPSGDVAFGIGAGALGIDGSATITDLDSDNFSGGQLTVAITTNATNSDRLGIRNSGTATGQIGVSSNGVTYGGTPIGTFSGGEGSSPLVITLSGNATPAAAQALLRAITYDNVAEIPSTAPRTVLITVSDGSGNTSQPIAKTINLGLRRTTIFQEGVDHGFGTYTGTADVEIVQGQPNATFPTGSNTNGLNVVGGANVSQTLLRFDNLFGNGPGQIPFGALITSAELVLDVNGSGDDAGPRFFRMLQAWDPNAATWNGFANGIQANDVEARAAYESTLNNATGDSASTTIGQIATSVTADLQAWSNGAANHGWAVVAARPVNANNFAFSSSESPALLERPMLRVNWVPAGTAVVSFRDGVNGYTGTVDTQLAQSNPGTGAAAAVNLNVDFRQPATPNAVHVLLKFEEIVGSALGQIPAGVVVYAATLTLPAMGSDNAPGDGGKFHQMLTPWTDTATWDSMVDGISADGTEASVNYSAQAGNSSRNPDAQAGFNVFDVTSDVRAWVDGTVANQGWAVLPWTSGDNGWIFNSSEATNVNFRPMLTVYYQAPPGATVTQTAGSTSVVEGGAADDIAVVLNAQPTADVIITIDDGNQLTSTNNTLTFTSANWNVPQTVSVSGVSDGVAEGDHSGTVSFSAASADSAYNGISIGSVSVQIADPSLLKVMSTQPSTSGVSFSFDRPVTVADLNLYDSSTGALGPADVTVVGNTTGLIRGTLIVSPDNQQFTFIASGARLAPDTYTLTLRSAANGFKDANGVLLDGDADTTPGGNYTTTFTVAAPDANELLISISDFARGPGQAVNLPTSTSSGIPVQLSSGQNVTSVTFDLNYNPALLGVTNFATTIPGATASFSSPSAGVARVTVSAPTEFGSSAGGLELGRFVASVPDNAPYATKQALTLSNLAAVDATSAPRAIAGDAGVHLSSYVGDTNGNGSYSGADTTLLQRIVVGSGTGFTAYQLADPRLMADINNSRSTTGGDTTLLQRLIVGTPITQAPALPNGITPAAPTGPDPRLYIPTTLAGEQGDTVTVPVMLRVTEPGGISISSVDLAIAYDPAIFTLSNFRIGGLLGGAGGGFSFTTNTATPGILNVTMSKDFGPDLAFNAEGAVFEFDVTVNAAAPNGSTTFNLLQNSANLATAVANNDVEELTLIPAPTNGAGDAVDGQFLIGPAAGIIVTPTSGLTTTEAGGQATFTVVLNSQPTADVTIPLSSSDNTEGTVPPVSITFTPANWNVPQTVTVTGVDDFADDGNVAYTVVTGSATSTDQLYAGLNGDDVALTNTDNDIVGITVTPQIGLQTTEAGGTATFTIVLASQPTADVTIPLSSSDTTEGTVSPTSVTFTPDNWNVPQTVTLTGVDDVAADGTVSYSIVTGTATSTDPAYAGLDGADVSASNADNDAIGIMVSPTSGLSTTESGGTATFTIVLASQPTADVTIPLSSSDATEGTVSPASVTFTPANWNVPQTVTITGADDLIADGLVAYTIITGAATSTDAAYAGLDSQDVAVNNTDDDASGILVTPISGLTTTEAGGTATFTIVLTSQPTADVTIPLSTSDATEGTVSLTSVTFTAANWNVPQTVTVTGVGDFIVDGSVAYTVITGAATSTDPAYAGLNADDVGVTNSDDDTAGITITPASGLTTTEAGGNATFTIMLTAQPTGNVTIPLTSSDATEGSVSPASVTFTPESWNQPQTVTVTGADDLVVDGTVNYSIVTGAATSADSAFAGLNASDVAVSNSDNDTAGITVNPTSGLTTTEAGGTATFTIVLTSQPTADVTIPFSSSDATEGSVSPASITFSPANWNVPQTLTVTGNNDDAVDGTVNYSIVTGAAISTDPNYAGLDTSDVAVANADNDIAGITVQPTSGLTTTEAGGTATFTIVLNSQPTADVTIPLSSSDATEGSVSPASVTFTPANWNVPQTVTVIGVDDASIDGSVGYTVVTGAAVSTDPAYNGLAVADVSVTNVDDEANTPPTISDVANQTTDEDTPLSGIPVTVGDAQTVAEGLTVTATSNNTTLFPAGSVTLSGTGANRTIALSPAANQSGTATITVTVTDGDGASSTGTFFVTVTAVNDLPTISNVPDQATNEDVPLTGIPVTVGDTETAAGDLTVTAAASDTTLFPVGSIVVSGTGASRTLSLTPAANASGSATITLTLMDASGATATDTFVVTVTAVNDLPTISDVADQSTAEDLAISGIPVTVGDVETPAADLTVTATSSNIALFPTGSIVVSGTGASRTLSLTPAANASGTATITLTVTDASGATVTDTFVVTVSAVNDLPTISDVADQTTSEDTPFNGISVTVGDAETPTSDLTVTTSSSSSTLFPAGSIVVLGTGAHRTISLTPAANQSGAATITVTVTDGNGGSVSDTFTVNVTAVNDAPVATNSTLAVTANQPTSGTLTATDIDNTSLTYSIVTQPTRGTVTITNPSTGAYTYTPSQGATGSDSFQFAVTDGTASSNVATVSVTIATVGTPNSVTRVGNDLVITGTTGPDVVTVVNVLGQAFVLLNGRPYGPFQVPGQLVIETGDSRDIINSVGWNGNTRVNAGAGDDSVATGGGNDTVIGGAGSDFLWVGRGSNIVWGDAEGAALYSPGAGRDLILSLDGDDQIFAGGGEDTVYSGSGNDTVDAGDGDDTVFGEGGNDQLRGGSGTDHLFGGPGNNVIIDAPAGTSPTISDVPNQTVSEDGSLSAIPVVIGDAETAATSLRLTAVADNTVLFPAGSIALVGTGANRSITLRPAANQSGTAKITLTVIDDSGSATTETFLVTVTPVNDAPVAANGNLTVAGTQPTSGVLTATDSDSGSLTYSIVTPPTKGSLTITNPATGAYLYTPNPGSNGIDSFQFVASDGIATSNPATVTVNATTSTQPNSVVPVGSDLHIYGSSAADTVTVLPATGGVRVILNGRIFGPYTVSGRLVIDTGDSADVINTVLWTGATQINSGAGNDTVTTGSGNDAVIGGAGSDTIHVGAGNNIVWGDAEGQSDDGSGAGADSIVSLAGNDQVFGGGGNDNINSGAGNDFVHAGSGNDVVMAGSGDDTVRGGLGDDQLYAGAGDDIVLGSGGNDLLYGEAGRDLVAGDTGRDVLFDTDFDSDILLDSTLSQSNYTGPISTSNLRSASDMALQAILSEWVRGAGSLAQRAQRIRVGGGLNGANTLAAGGTVTGDDQQDTLSSSVLSTDWLFAEAGLDRVTRQPGDLFDGT